MAAAAGVRGADDGWCARGPHPTRLMAAAAAALLPARFTVAPRRVTEHSRCNGAGAGRVSRFAGGAREAAVDFSGEEERRFLGKRRVKKESGSLGEAARFRTRAAGCAGEGKRRGEEGRSFNATQRGVKKKAVGSWLNPVSSILSR